MEIKYFQFENDFTADDMRCIPMIVRFKLDACGIKLKLSEWSRMQKEERDMLAQLPIDTSEELFHYRAYVKGVVFLRTGSEATELTNVPNDSWANKKQLPEDLQHKLNQINRTLSLRKWASLTNLQRFALMKLAQSSHENKNLPKALKEFEIL
jgi:hypothetical protein